MKRFNKIVFSEYTQTYRAMPQNYWLASVRKGKLVFDSWDKAIVGYRYKNKVRLMWLLNYIKNGMPQWAYSIIGYILLGNLVLTLILITINKQ